MTEKKLTMLEALDYQAKHLKAWQMILDDRTYRELLQYALDENAGTQDPYRVFRGKDIQQWVENKVNHLIEYK